MVQEVKVLAFVVRTACCILKGGRCGGKGGDCGRPDLDCFLWSSSSGGSAQLIAANISVSLALINLCRFFCFPTAWSVSLSVKLPAWIHLCRLVIAFEYRWKGLIYLFICFALLFFLADKEYWNINAMINLLWGTLLTRSGIPPFSEWQFSKKIICIKNGITSNCMMAAGEQRLTFHFQFV